MKNPRLIALAVLAAVAQLGEFPFGRLHHVGIAQVSAQETADEGDAIEPIDGVGNNVANPMWGSAGTDLLRVAPVGYADGVDSPSLPGNQSARVISNLLNSQAVGSGSTVDIATVDQISLSDFGYAFGQFMDHDMDLTLDGTVSFPIPVAAGDPIGPDPLPFDRSVTDPSSSPAQQVNAITSYLDLSQVYGSSQVVADAIRTFSGGLLKTSSGNMLPYNNTTYFTADQITAMNMANDAEAVDSTALFAAGDRRANENIELTALVTLFVRNHNRIAAELLKNHPDATDEELYQEARKLNIAEYQQIIYSEWIPAVLGPKALMPYRGYRPNVDASISNEFSTVAYRFGHSMVSPSIAREGNDGQAVTDDISLAFDFFDPNLLNPNGVVDPLTGLESTDIGPILKGDADGNGQAMDLLAIEDIRNLLFGDGGLGGQDLMALDVQRGRDHGIPDYNTVRKAYGLPAAKSFMQIAGDETPKTTDATSVDPVVQELLQAYPGGVGTVDAFEGGLAEPHVPASDVGPTFQVIMTDQFERLRDGDRFFYLNERFSAEESAIFQQTDTLAKVIMANTDVKNLQNDAIVFHASISGAVTGGKAVVVDLEDTSGDVLASTMTAPNGQYSFDELSGPAADPAVTPGVSSTGSYEVVVEAPRGFTQTSKNPAAILISKGDTHVAGVNFSLAALKAPVKTPVKAPPPPAPPKVSGPPPMR